MAGRFSVEAVFKAVDRVTAPVSKMQNRVGKFTRSTEKNFRKLNKSVGKFTDGIKQGAIAVGAATAVMAVALTSVVATGAEFEQTIVNAAAKFPGEIQKGSAAFKGLEDAAKQTGKTTEFSASQAAGALNFLAMAGFDAESAVAALPGVVDLATAAGVDLATATDIASDSLGAFGLATKDPIQLGKNLARVNDILAKTSTSANTTVEGLFEAIKEGGPIAVTSGASMETFAALAGELANAGIKGSQAGTTLKNMFLKLAAPAGDGAKLLERFGVQTRDTNGDMLDIVDILGKLDTSLGGLGTAEKSGVLEAIFGKIPLAGVNVLLKSGSKKLNEYRGELEAASGASAKMAGVMRDTLQGRLNSLSSAVEGVKISIFSMTSGPLSDVIDKTTEWVRVNEGLISSKVGGFLAMIISNFDKIVTWTKRIGVGFAVFLVLAGVLKTFIVVLTAVNLVMALNPVGLMVLGIVALIAAIALAVAAIIKWKDVIIGAFLGMSDSVLVVAGIIGSFVIGPMALLMAAGLLLIKNWEPVGEFFSSLWGGIVEMFDKSVGRILKVVDKIKSVAASVSKFLPEGETRPGILGFTGGSPLLSDGSDGAEAGGGGADPQVVSPQERVAASIEERRTTSSAEVTIRDETKRAEVTGGSLGPGLNLISSGAF